MDWYVLLQTIEDQLVKKFWVVGDVIVLSVLQSYCPNLLEDGVLDKLIF